MFIIKNNYYLYIENTQLINLDGIRNNKKISIIYRNNRIAEPLKKVQEFRNKCKRKAFKFYVANDLKLARVCNADGLYLSSYNKNYYYNQNLELIGSAHNFKEIYQKIKQRCGTIIVSRLFQTNYKNKKSFLGVCRFNLLKQNYYIDLVPLGGVNSDNLLKVNLVKSSGVCFLSEIKKKPVISNRLF
jgi:thiamine monophosphate synthase|tara:strand:- start:602 stop:1162 length:561 start_codon:yes stop_codon:yes gene_type:complete